MHLKLPNHQKDIISLNLKIAFPLENIQREAALGLETPSSFY